MTEWPSLRDQSCYPTDLSAALKREEMDGWMGGWVDGWMDRWVDGWVDGWMSGWMDGFTFEVHLLVTCA